MDASGLDCGGEKKNLSRIALKLVEHRCKCRTIMSRSHICGRLWFFGVVVWFLSEFSWLFWKSQNIVKMIMQPLSLYSRGKDTPTRSHPAAGQVDMNT
jgi:hypothetical protein